MTRTFLITGATDGIGLQTALDLAAADHHLILHGRNPDRLARAAARLRATPVGDVQTVRADFSVLDAVRRLAAQLNETLEKIDVLVNNAGIFLNERRMSADGFEMTWAVNHVAPFVLTHALLPLLQAAPQGRIVNVSSIAHTRGRLNRADLNLSHGFDGYTAYAQSKLANVLFTRALAEKLKDTAITVNALHPGVVGTKLLKEAFNMRGNESLSEGAATSVRLATDPSLSAVSGAYFSVGRQTDVAPQARDPEAAAWLYQWTAAQTATPPL